MKERIVIDNNQHLPRASYYVAKDGHYDVGTVNYATPETILNENRIVAVKERVPETWEELKELCKKTGHYAVNILKGGLLNKEYIFIFGLSFRDNGDIEDIENNNVAENRTPQQMWQIIKNLIGEE